MHETEAPEEQNKEEQTKEEQQPTDPILAKEYRFLKNVSDLIKDSPKSTLTTSPNFVKRLKRFRIATHHDHFQLRQGLHVSSIDERYIYFKHRTNCKVVKSSYFWSSGGNPRGIFRLNLLMKQNDPEIERKVNHIKHSLQKTDEDEKVETVFLNEEEDIEEVVTDFSSLCMGTGAGYLAQSDGTTLLILSETETEPEPDNKKSEEEEKIGEGKKLEEEIKQEEEAIKEEIKEVEEIKEEEKIGEEKIIKISLLPEETEDNNNNNNNEEPEQKDTGTVKTLRLKKLFDESTIGGNQLNGVSVEKISENLTLILTSKNGSSLQLWKLPEMKLFQDLHPNKIFKSAEVLRKEGDDDNNEDICYRNYNYATMSKDGSRIVTVIDSCDSVFVWTWNSEKLRYENEEKIKMWEESNSAMGCDWDPTDTLIAAAGSQAVVYSYKEKCIKKVFKTSENEDSTCYRLVKFSPNRKVKLLVACQDNDDVHFINTDTWEEQIVKGLGEITGVAFSRNGKYVYLSYSTGIDVFEYVGTAESLLSLAIKAIQRVGGLEAGVQKYKWTVGDIPYSLVHTINTSVFF